MIITNTNLGNLQVDGVYIEPVLVPPASPGPATGLLGIVGGANYGPVNQPTPFSDPASLFAAFGNDTASSHALSRAALSAMPEGQNFLGVRVTDGTDAASVIDLACGGQYASGPLTIAGTPAAGNVVTAGPFISGVNTFTAAPYTVTASDTVATIAAAVAAKINACGAVTGAQAFLQPCNAVAGVITIYAANAGTGGNAITIQGSATGGGTTITPTTATPLTGGTAGGGLNLAILTSKFTGSYANNATATVSYQSGGPDNYPVLSLALAFPGYPTEVFNNIVAYVAGNPAFSNSTAQANVLAAVNGTIPGQAGSARWTATAGNATTPVIAKSNAASGGTDGTGFTDTAELGVDGITGRTGLYALRGLVSSGQVLLAGATNPVLGSSLIAFRQAENCLAHLAFPLGTTTASALSTRQANALSDPGLVLSLDWQYVFDVVQKQAIYVPPSAKIAGIIASLPSYLSPGNQPAVGAAGVIGTERITNGVNTVSVAEAAQRQQNGLAYLGYMPRAIRGPQLGMPHGMASDGVTRITDYRMLALSIDTIQANEGQFVDSPMSASASNLGQPAFGLIQDTLDAVFGGWKTSQQIADYSVTLPSQNTPTTVGEGYLILSVLIQTMSSAQFIVNLLQVGPNVVVNAQAA